MALKYQITRTAFSGGLLFIVVVSMLFNPISAVAMGNSIATIPGFSDFSQAVHNGKADTLGGVYVQNVLALPVVQQPAGNSGYVSNNDAQLTPRLEANA